MITTTWLTGSGSFQVYAGTHEKYRVCDVSACAEAVSATKAAVTNSIFFDSHRSLSMHAGKWKTQRSTADINCRAKISCYFVPKTCPQDLNLFAEAIVRYVMA